VEKFHFNHQRIEGIANVIKFFCDSCGADISERVYDSVRQFSEPDQSERSILAGVTHDGGQQISDEEHEIKHQGEQVRLDVQLLADLSKLIHSYAWGGSATTMRCDHCPMEDGEIREGTVITIFTRIPQEQTASVAN
jgi:hypothetical protein